MPDSEMLAVTAQEAPEPDCGGCCLPDCSSCSMVITLLDVDAAKSELIRTQAARIAELEADKRRLDWLEAYVNKHGALVLHDGDRDPHGYSGLGLRPGYLIRTLRQAIDGSMKEGE